MRPVRDTVREKYKTPYVVALSRTSDLEERVLGRVCF